VSHVEKFKPASIGARLSGIIQSLVSDYKIVVSCWLLVESQDIKLSTVNQQLSTS